MRGPELCPSPTEVAFWPGSRPKREGMNPSEPRRENRVRCGAPRASAVSAHTGGLVRGGHEKGQGGVFQEEPAACAAAWGSERAQRVVNDNLFNLSSECGDVRVESMWPVSYLAHPWSVGHTHLDQEGTQLLPTAQHPLTLSFLRRE